MNSPLFLTAALGRGCPFVAAAVSRGGCFPRSRSGSGILFWILIFLFGGLIRVLPAAEIATDKLDYPPFSEVIVTGSGFAAGEEVQLQLETLDADGVTWTVLPDDPVWPNPWTVTADAGGGIVDIWQVYTEDFLGVSFRLTATGSQSGETAVTTFTDSEGDYSLNFAAADPDGYIPPIPFPETITSIVGRGDGDSRIPSAWFESPVTDTDVRVESLAPETMALHQIVPFELKITVNGDTLPENGTITFTAGWNIDTTSNDDFGYDESYGVIAAFVDTGDGEHIDPGGDATVSSFSWAVVGDEIVGTFVVTGLDDDDVVVIEPWLVLEDSIPAGSTGNVQSRLISANTVPEGDKAISTGNQTVPLLRVQEFFSADADLLVEKTAGPVCLGEDITYEIVVTNLSEDTVANGVVVTDTLGANQTYVSAAGAPSNAVGQVVTFTLGALVPGQSVNLTVVATPTASGAVSNEVVVAAITDDPAGGNNSDTTSTTVHPLPPCEITTDSLLVAGQPATFHGPEGMASYAWSASYNGEPAVDVDGLADLETVIPQDAVTGTIYLTVSNGFGCSSSCELELEAISTVCISAVPPTCPGEDQLLELEIAPPSGSEIVWSIEPDDGPAVLEVAQDELSATVSSPTCAQFVVSVEVTPPGGSTITCTTSGSFVDDADPVLPTLPVGGDLGCNPPPPACAEVPDAEDNCGPVPVICTPGVVEVIGCSRSQTFTYSATDACGNEASGEVTYTWKVDTTDPVLPDLPDGGDLGCNPTLPQCVAVGDATDDCDGLVAVTCTPGLIEEDGCLRRQVFTYSAEDACENEASDTVVYTWKVDLTDPVLPDLPTGGDLGCNPALPQCVTDLEASDDCDGLIAVACTPGQIEEEGCLRRQVFTYSAEDACENEASDTVVYTWKVDTTDPVLPDLPDGGDLGCNPTLPQCVAVGDATDDCDGLVAVTCTPGQIEEDGCLRRQVFTYSAEDACENEASDTVVYIWKVDTTDPVLPDLPDGGDLGCNPALPECVTGLEATDDCDGLIPVTCTPGQIEEDGCLRRQVFTYSAEDACENEASDTVVYTWKVDTTDPVLPDLPDGGDLGCNPTLPQCVTVGDATDDCDGLVEVTCTPGLIEEDGCLRRQVFTYSAEDACENEASDTVVYIWRVDLTDPVLPDLPTGGNIGCNPSLPQCDDSLVAQDECGEVPVICSAGVVSIDGCFRSQVFTFTATDDCGNDASDTVTYEWTEDAIDPVLPTLPTGGDLGCNPELPQCDDSLMAEDGCGQVPVICSAGPVTGEGCEKSQTFTYTATDDCGNDVSGEVTYTWTEDTTDPEITCPPDINVTFPHVPAPATTVEELEELGGSASDACGEVTISSSDSEPTGDCPRTFTRTYTATDACGNEATCEQTITQLCPSLVTSSSLCTFDVDKDCEDAFRLSFHQTPGSASLWKITNSNPGQFYYNVFVSGNEGDPVNVAITIPYPFVTHGAQPIHVYEDYTVSGSEEAGYCLVPGRGASGFTIGTATGADGVQNYSPSGSEIIVLGDYSAGTPTTTVTVSGGTVPASGTLAVTIHLDFGLKKTNEWTQSSGAAVGTGSLLGVQLDPCQEYAFSFADAGLGLSDEQIVHSINSFKRNPGFGASITLSPELGGTPLKGVKFEAWNANGTTKIGEGFTDQDGAGMISYKHKSKAADYWIKVPAYQKSVKVNIKANGFGLGEFQVP